MAKKATKIDALKAYEAGMIADQIIHHCALWGAGIYPIINPVADYLMEHRWPYKDWATKTGLKDLKAWRTEFIKAYIMFGGNLMGG